MEMPDISVRALQDATLIVYLDKDLIIACVSFLGQVGRDLLLTWYKDKEQSHLRISDEKWTFERRLNVLAFRAKEGEDFVTIILNR